jgi:anti-sigma regulatory factor (Ser/Thr protein kinase)
VIAPGTSVVLYTDGIVERRGASIDDGMARMAELVAAAPRDLHPEGMCDVLLRRLGTEARAPDDITLLVFEHQELGPQLVRRYPARLEMLRVVRADVRCWLEANGVIGDAAIDLLLMSGEASANAISHGSMLAGHDTIAVSLEHLGDAVVVAVSDNGTWPEGAREPQPGHGLDIMSKTADELTILSNSFGTTVRMVLRVR